MFMLRRGFGNRRSLDGRQRKLICFECLGEGHYAEECPSRRKIKQGVRCYICGRLGHIMKNYSTRKWADFKPYGTCRESRDEVPGVLGKTQSEISFTSSNRELVALYKSTESLQLVIRVEGIDCHTMLDSGSTISL